MTSAANLGLILKNYVKKKIANVIEKIESKIFVSKIYGTSYDFLVVV